MTLSLYDRFRPLFIAAMYAFLFYLGAAKLIQSVGRRMDRLSTASMPTRDVSSGSVPETWMGAFYNPSGSGELTYSVVITDSTGNPVSSLRFLLTDSEVFTDPVLLGRLESLFKKREPKPNQYQVKIVAPIVVKGSGKYRRVDITKVMNNTIDAQEILSPHKKFYYRVYPAQRQLEIVAR